MQKYIYIIYKGLVNFLTSYGDKGPYGWKLGWKKTSKHIVTCYLKNIFEKNYKKFELNLGAVRLGHDTDPGSVKALSSEIQKKN